MRRVISALSRLRALYLRLSAERSVRHILTPERVTVVARLTWTEVVRVKANGWPEEVVADEGGWLC